MKIGSRTYKKLKTFNTSVEAHREASRWLKNFHAKVVERKGKYIVYIAP